jgi:hypothetical protein
MMQTCDDREEERAAAAEEIGAWQTARALEGRRLAEDPQQVKICGPQILNLPSQIGNCWTMSIYSLGKWFLDLAKV